MSQITLALVMPCYNEEEILHKTAEACLDKIISLERKYHLAPSYIVMVDDGSKDNTWEIIKSLCNTENSKFKGVKLSKNCGHQNALFAGLMYAKEISDCIVSLDADLQDDINVIDTMIEKYISGCQIVYGIRKSRSTDSYYKMFTARLFYKLMLVMGVNIIYDHADYRLTSKRVLNELEDYKESNLFLRSIFPQLGFKSDKVYYDRLERTAGETKYPFSKMFNFAIEGITSSSVSPLRYIALIGFIAMIMSFIGSLWALYTKFTNQGVPGWASIVLPVYFISGLQIASIGVLGEYIGKIYKETKRRPKYIVEKYL